MNILDLGPAEFLAALDELGIVGEQRDALVSQYSDPSRGYERDERPFLTRLADNVIGFDDGVETQGERIGQGARTFFDAVRSDPLGTAGSMVSGAYGEIERAVRGELSPTETLLMAPAAGLGFAARGATTVGRRTGDPTPDAAYDPWSNLNDFDFPEVDYEAAAVEPAPTAAAVGPAGPQLAPETTLAEELMGPDAGLPIAGAGTGFQQTPFDPNDIDLGPTIEQMAAGADDPFGLEAFNAMEDEFDNFTGPNPWTNVQDAEDMAAAYAADPFRGTPGSRVLPDTAPATSIVDANPYMPTNATFQRPRTWADQGAAGIYSRSARAASQLRQPRYSDIETLRRELEARGASPRELDYQIDAFDEDFAAGSVSREDVQRFFSDYDTGLMLDRTLQYASSYMPPGGRNATSTVYYHPEGQNYPRGAKRHFPDVGNSTGQNAAPLFHSRAAQYDLEFPGGGTAHHVAEIQSDFAQYRQTVPKEDRDAFDQQYDAPYIRRENDWVDAAIRQNLLDAVNSGSDWITFGNGRQANQHIGMPREAAESFYDTRVPRRLEDVLRRFSNRSGIEAPRLERVPFVDGDDVLGFRITPEFREALIQNGLPSYKNGGIVSLL